MQQLACSHLEGIFSKVIGHPGLTRKVSTMVHDGQTDLVPADSDCSFLQVLGLAKRQGSKLVFRNALYASVAKVSSQILAIPAQPSLYTAVFSIPKTDLAL